MHLHIPKIFQFIDRFDQNLIKKNIRNLGIIYRNYSRPINENSLIKFKKFCKKNKFNFYLANQIKLAIKFNLNGVYLPSFNKKTKIHNSTIYKNFQILGSAHNNIEINNKINQGCEVIFLSPLFKNKKSSKFLDITKFNLLTLNHKVKFIALGGINEKNIKKIKLLNAFGYSGISFFQKKTGL